jgi:hypothetical protein
MDTHRRFPWALIIVSLALFTAGCASGRGLSTPDFTGERRDRAAELEAQAEITWVVHNTNWHAYRVAAMIEGTTRYDLGIVDGGSALVLRRRAPFTTGRAIVFELTNRVDGSVVRLEPREVAPGCKVLLTIQPFARQSTLLVDFGG